MLNAAGCGPQLRPTGELFAAGAKEYAMTTILVVDDEPLIRWAVREGLEGAGYAVIEAGSAGEAIASLVDGGAGVSVALLDLKLPDSDDLIAKLPHRPPFRFVDAVDECEPSVRVRARYRVSGEEAFLAGHFPGNPILPGVIQIEALAQAAVISLATDPRYEGRLALFGGVVLQGPGKNSIASWWAWNPIAIF